jgi:hypothetical protein
MSTEAIKHDKGAAYKSDEGVETLLLAHVAVEACQLGQRKQETHCQFGNADRDTRITISRSNEKLLLFPWQGRQEAPCQNS